MTKLWKAFGVLCVAFSLSGCAAWRLPSTQGDPENAPQSAGYQPLDPMPVAFKSAPVGVKLKQQDLLDALPDETMRIAVGKLDVHGGVTYGPVAISAANTSYQVIVDYIKSNTTAIPVEKSVSTEAATNLTTITAKALPKGSTSPTSVPVYIGVGLRLTANLTTTEAGINLGNLIAIGAAASANKLSGTLVVQTLGMSGENISTAIPIPTEISGASITNAIQALGTMKAKVYQDKTLIQPRVTGVYNNLGGGAVTINGFISSLLQNPVALEVPVR